MKNIKRFDEDKSNVINKDEFLEDIKERMDIIESQMEIVKDNKMYSYALSRMYTLLEELRYKYSK